MAKSSETGRSNSRYSMITGAPFGVPQECGEGRRRLAGATPALGDEAGHEPRRRDVETWIGSGSSRRRDLDCGDRAVRKRPVMFRTSSAPRSSMGMPRAVIAGASRCVESRAARRRTARRCRRGERLQIGADLVGDVAVGGDAVGADDAEIDLPALHEMPPALSAMIVCGTPCAPSSQAVSEAPWLRGRVSSTQTWSGMPASIGRVDRRRAPCPSRRWRASRRCSG